MSDHGQGNGTEFTYEIAEGESITQGVLEAVSSASNTPIVPDFQSEATLERALEPLYTAIDPDALDSLFASGTDTTNGQVEFQYHGYRVTVESGGCISLTKV